MKLFRSWSIKPQNRTKPSPKNVSFYYIRIYLHYVIEKHKLNNFFLFRKKVKKIHWKAIYKRK